jgi:hypothetical protein
VLRATQSAILTILDSGEQRRNQSPTSDGAKGFEVFDFYVSRFLSALESRLTKSKSAIIQIFVVMTSTETESAAIISALQEMKFGIDIICSKNDSRNDSNYASQSHSGDSALVQNEPPRVSSSEAVISRRQSRVQA